MLAEIFLKELERFADNAASSQYQGVVVLGRELAKKYREQQETLANISSMYVKTYNDFADYRKSGGAVWNEFPNGYRL